MYLTVVKLLYLLYADKKWQLFLVVVSFLKLPGLWCYLSVYYEKLSIFLLQNCKLILKLISFYRQNDCIDSVLSCLHKYLFFWILISFIPCCAFLLYITHLTLSLLIQEKLKKNFEKWEKYWGIIHFHKLSCCVLSRATPVANQKFIGSNRDLISDIDFDPDSNATFTDGSSYWLSPDISSGVFNARQAKWNAVSEINC